jgi:hypothetical protein
LPEEPQSGRGLVVAPIATHLIAPVPLDQRLDRRLQPKSRAHLLEEQGARRGSILVGLAQDRQARRGVDACGLNEGLRPFAEEPVAVNQGVVEVEYDQARLSTAAQRYPRWAYNS